MLDKNSIITELHAAATLIYKIITPSPEHPNSIHLKGLSSDGSDPGDRVCFSLNICYINGWP